MLLVRAFDWRREYAPYWEPGTSAFWLSPGPGDLQAGEWPLPFTVPSDLPVYNEEEGEWYHDGERVREFNYTLSPSRGHRIIYVSGRTGFITDFHLGLCSGFKTVRGYLDHKFYDELEKEIEKRKAARQAARADEPRPRRFGKGRSRR